ncbi:hypothetical protein [Altibacter lentus]|uniref:hypothetical protein n=1 Tax=Altibacter lentus TaxID=1223410 RepID=UPI000691FB7A|nr:hypothetical protein [Altibacter lentus]
MLQRYLCLILFLLSYVTLFAQQHNEYLGVIKLSDSSLISYKIIFSENNGFITGHSITDLNGPHETKSLLTGTFNDAENLLIFKESGIIYTKSSITQADFCYVNFTGRLKKINKRQQIKGTFKGLYNNGEECVNGEIQLANLERIVERAEKVDRKIDRSIFVKQEDKDRINMKKTLDTLSMNLINKGETLSVFTKDQKVTLVIYDAGKEDGDRIDLAIAGSKVLDNFTVTRKKKTIMIDLKDETTLIEVLALNVGTSAPNTVRIEIIDSKNFIRTLTNLETNERAGVTLIKK